MLQAPTNDRKTKAEASSKTAEYLPEHEQSSQLMSGMGQFSAQEVLLMRQSHPMQKRDNLAALQKVYGNQAVLRMRLGENRRSTTVQPMQGGVLQRRCACGNTVGEGGTGAECQQKQQLSLQHKTQGAKAGGEVPSIVHEVLNSPGQSLELETRTFMESRFEQDFGDIQVHDDAKAHDSAKAVNASAYTVKKNIVFGEGKYDPHSMLGQRLIAHELTHTIQQQQSEPAMQSSLNLAHNNTQQEQEAEDVANAVVQGQPIGISQFHSPQVVRQTAMDGGVDEETPRDAGLPGGVETPVTESASSSGGSSSGGGGSGGVPSVPDCTAVMGGRGINYYGLGLLYNHTYVNFKESASDYWLIEGGPLSSDPKTSGAWAKPKSWESDGNRKTTTWPPSDCPAVKKLLFDTQTIYHSKALPYNATAGPNSNSFAEHLTFKAGVPAVFDCGTICHDKAYDYWKSHTRPS